MDLFRLSQILKEGAGVIVKSISENPGFSKSWNRWNLRCNQDLVQLGYMYFIPKFLRSAVLFRQQGLW